MAYALTISEPYATLIADGYKKVETRGWKAPDSMIGETIYIHAGKFDYPQWKDMKQLKSFLDLELHRGCFVAKAKLVGCVPTEEANVTDFERSLGFYDNGRWAWIFDDVESLEPVPAKGALRIWNFNEDEYYTKLTIK